MHTGVATYWLTTLVMVRLRANQSAIPPVLVACRALCSEPQGRLASETPDYRC